MINSETKNLLKKYIMVHTIKMESMRTQKYEKAVLYREKEKIIIKKITDHYGEKSIEVDAIFIKKLIFDETGIDINNPNSIYDIKIILRELEISDILKD